MTTYSKVIEQLDGWRTMGMSKSEIVVALAEACMGWPYVWGGYGQKCTEKNRASYADRSSCPPAETEVIRKKCQRLRSSNPLSTCSGCRWFPGGETAFFDCRGFTRWCFARIGISIQGAGATSQWNTATNWTEKGTIDTLPPDKVCCVFMRDGTKMSHTGIHVGGGVIIHCSGEVKRGKSTDRGWTHWATPKGMEGGITPVPDPEKTRPIIRKGSNGTYVKELQTALIQLGYDCGKAGADGKCGTGTVAAIRAFQGDHPPLVADGICGRLTWAAVDEALKAGPQDRYTVIIPHLALHHAEALKNAYSDARIEKEVE